MPVKLGSWYFITVPLESLHCDLVSPTPRRLGYNIALIRKPDEQRYDAVDLRALKS